jgi:hypothetical protein
MFRELVGWVVCFLVLVGCVFLMVLFIRTGLIYHMPRPRLTLLLCATVLGTALSLGAAFVYRMYALARGRRDRSDGIACAACGRRAFPVEGTTNGYRCGICKGRFEGPGHFN